MLIDVHTHIFADKIAAKATEFLTEYYSISVPYKGTLTELAQIAIKDQFDAIVCFNAATKPTQVKKANDWIIKHIPSQIDEMLKIVRFGCYHVGDKNWKNEIDRLRSAGIKGIKIHPEFQNIDLSDERLYPFFEEIRDDFVVLVHVGDPVISQDNRSTPRKIAKLALKFPRTRFIAAHMGGYLFWDDAIEQLRDVNVWVDTSSAMEYITQEKAKELLDAFGVERILLGSDYPMQTPGGAMRLLDERMPWLTGGDRDRIFGNNAAELLNLND